MSAHAEWLVVQDGARRVTAAVNGRAGELDEWLAGRSASQWAFVPLFDPPGSRRARGAASRERRELAELAPGHDPIDAELHGEGHEPVPGLLFVGMTRAEARLLAGERKRKQFLWGARSGPAERHPVDVTDDDDSDTMLESSRTGLRDLGRALLAAAGDAVPRAARLVGGAIVLVSIVVALLTSQFADVLREHLPDLLLHPAVVPAVLVGLHLRLRFRDLVRRERELNALEAEQVWRRVAPDVALAWAAALGAVSAFVVAPAALGSGASIAAIVDDVAKSLLACLWCLPVVSYSRSVDAAFEALIDALVWLFVSIVILRFTLFAANLVTNVIFWALHAFLPIAIPEPVVDATTSATEIGGELVFTTYMLGYTWTKARRWFELWASRELPGD